MRAWPWTRPCRPCSRRRGVKPVAQLGAGPDGICILARRGGQIVEVHQLSFAAGLLRWHRARGGFSARCGASAWRARALAPAAPPASRVCHRGYRAFLARGADRTVGVDIVRALRILIELARALAAAHRIGCTGDYRGTSGSGQTIARALIHQPRDPLHIRGRRAATIPRKSGQASLMVRPTCSRSASCSTCSHATPAGPTTTPSPSIVADMTVPEPEGGPRSTTGGAAPPHRGGRDARRRRCRTRRRTARCGPALA